MKKKFAFFFASIFERLTYLKKQRGEDRDKDTERETCLSVGENMRQRENMDCSQKETQRGKNIFSNIYICQCCNVIQLRYVSVETNLPLCSSLSYSLFTPLLNNLCSSPVFKNLSILFCRYKNTHK